MTLKAVRLLGEAQVVLLDALVNREVLRFVAPGAQVVEVGKRGGRHSATQEEIQQQMLEHALTGKTVARLKGGDPFMFGRGGEEGQCRTAAVEVGARHQQRLAAPATLGVPLTHRAWSQGAVFVTGHGKDAASEPNWAALAQSGLTLVVYMGVARCEAIQAGLLAGGAKPETPVAVVQSATRARQRQLLTTLGQLPGALRDSGLGSPSILVIGDVVRCADEWRDLAELAPPPALEQPAAGHAAARRPRRVA